MTLSTVSLRSCLLSVVLAAAASGCGGTGVSQGNFDKVAVGMSQEQVEAVLGTDKEKTTTDVGTPGMSMGGMTVSATSVKVLTWADGSKTITIGFKDGKVVTKAQNGL